MSKKGFTIIELLAVIVILGILSSIATIGVTRYRQKVTEKELINLHSTIETGFDNYRSKVILSGEVPKKELSLCESGKLLFDISYNGKRLKCGNGEEDIDAANTTVSVKVKGDLLGDNEYIGNKNLETIEKDYIKDGICMVKSIEPNGESTIQKECVSNGSGGYLPSKEEIICIKLKINSDAKPLIDDYADGNSMCKYWSE